MDFRGADIGTFVYHCHILIMKTWHDGDCPR